MVDVKVEKVFFALLRAGLWEKEVRLLSFDDKDLPELLRLAREQSVVGPVFAGMERLRKANADLDLDQDRVMQWIFEVEALERKNKAMNLFIAELVERMHKADIYAILVKGQGIAQYYERPQWRSYGDVDLFLSDDDYEKAKRLLVPLAVKVEPEGVYNKHLGIVVPDSLREQTATARAKTWVVELHGCLYSGLSSKIDRELDDIYRDSFERGRVRSWMNGSVQVPLLSAENDAFYVFTHILQHFYKGGIGLRQICDWCRLLFCYRGKLDLQVLGSRIKRAGLMSEWRAFGAFAVEHLGMEAAAVPFLGGNVDVDLDLNLNENDNDNDNDNLDLDVDLDINENDNDNLDVDVDVDLDVGGEISAGLKRKAGRIKDFVMMSGNFGQNRDMGYYKKYPYVIRKCMSLSQRVGDLIRHSRIFPMDSLRFFPKMMLNGVRSAMRGE